MKFPVSTIGDRFQGASGTTYVVDEIDEDGYPYLAYDKDILTDPDIDSATWDNRADDDGPLQPIPADPKITEYLNFRIQRQREVAEVTATVPREKQRDLYNTVTAVKYYSSKLLDSQANVDRVSADRARELRKLVDIVGTQTAVAKLLGMNQSTLSRALRDREK